MFEEDYTFRFRSIETASIFGGLGEAVTAVVYKNYPVQVIRIGITDRMGQSTLEVDVLNADYKLTVDDLVAAVKVTMKRKQ